MDSARRELGDTFDVAYVSSFRFTCNRRGKLESKSCFVVVSVYFVFMLSMCEILRNRVDRIMSNAKLLN